MLVVKVSFSCMFSSWISCNWGYDQGRAISGCAFVVAFTGPDLRALLFGLAQLMGDNWAVNNVLIHQDACSSTGDECVFTSAKLKVSLLQH